MTNPPEPAAAGDGRHASDHNQPPADAACDHEFTLNVQLTHAWCQKCDLVIPMVAYGIRDLIAGQERARERERITDMLLADKWPRMQLERLGLLGGEQP